MSLEDEDYPVVWIGLIAEADYPLARQLTGDAEDLPGAYEAYRDRLDTRVKEFRAAGYKVSYIDIDLEALRRFCAERKLKMNRRARILFVQNSL